MPNNAKRKKADGPAAGSAPAGVDELVAAYLAGRLAEPTPAVPGHSLIADLFDVARGTARDEVASRVAAHTADCAECRSRLVAFRGTAPAPPPFAPELVFQNLAEPPFDRDESRPPAVALAASLAGRYGELTGKKPDAADGDPGVELYAYYFGHKPPVPWGDDARRRCAAWWLWESLFLTACGEGLVRWRHARDDNYCPTFLVGEALDACFRLHPESCLRLPVRIDGRVSSVKLPVPPLDGSAIDRAAPAVRAVARYVAGYVLNLAMGTSARRIELGLRNLGENGDAARRAAERFWRDAVGHEYHANNFDGILGAYLDGYHLGDPHVRIDCKLVPEAVEAGRGLSAVRAELDQLLASAGAEPVFVLGCDVGASFVKLVTFELRTAPDGHAELAPFDPRGGDGGEPWRIVTAPADGTRYRGVEGFCERVLGEADRQLQVGPTKLSDIQAIGLTWPGPVRDNRVRGRSGILDRFEQEDGRPIAYDDFRAIQHLDVVGETRRLFRNRTGVGVATVLVNDGDANAFGVLSDVVLNPAADGRAWEELRRRGLAVVMVGTGTAGAVARDDRLQPGMMEFGKLLANVAYEPGGGYPRGLANHHASAKTLPRELIAAEARLGNLAPPLSSLEVGLLAGFAGVDDRAGLTAAQKVALGDLWLECGKAAAVHHDFKTIDAVELGNLLDHDGWVRRDVTRRMVESSLGLAGQAASDRLHELVRAHGIIRLYTILNLSQGNAAGEDEVAALQQFLAGSGVLPPAVRVKVRDLGRTALGCVRKLGEYLGDLAALLHSLHGLECVVIVGGVVSGETGVVAREEAARRLGRYGRFGGRPTARGRVIDLAGGSGPADGGAGNPDAGVLGAAVGAALELVRQKRREGLDAVRRLVQALRPTQQLRLGREQAAVVGRGEADPADPVPLRRHCLDPDLVRRFLDDNADDLGLMHTASDGVGAAEEHTYTRWTSPVGSRRGGPDRGPAPATPGAGRGPEEARTP